MCGLSGEINHDGRPADADALQRMTEALAPRGPDGAGIVLRGSVGLGHRRLKIIDLSEKAQQPMVDPELGIT
ncbi:MAG: N-acetylglutaminylglutamine amidotransferase, partial [Brevundimonas sp.]